MRSLLVVPVVLLLAAALVSPSLALAETTTSKEGLSGYGKEEPKKEEPKKEEPKSGTSPSKETVPPTNKEPTSPAEKAPSSTPSEPAKSASASPGSSTLPFTGLDLRLVVAVGILMMGAGFSIVVVQRRQRRR